MTAEILVFLLQNVGPQGHRSLMSNLPIVILERFDDLSQAAEAPTASC